MEKICFDILYKSNGHLNAARATKKWCYANGAEKIYNNIMDITNFLSPSASMAERMYCIENEIRSTILCKNCSKPVKYYIVNKKYSECCSVECARKLQHTKEGYINPFTTIAVIEKSKKSREIKYGDKNYRNDEKRNATILEKYGVANISQNMEVKRKKAEHETEVTKANRRTKMESTCVARYGCRHYMQSTEFVQSRYGWKDYVYSSGETLRLLGYEKYAAKILDDNGVKFNDVKINHTIPYTLNGIQRSYRPDFFLNEHNLCIEVKSTYTVSADGDKNIAKWNSAIFFGYVMEIWVIEPNINCIRKYSWSIGSSIKDILNSDRDILDQNILSISAAT